MSTQTYFHPLQSAKFKAGMDRVKKNEKRKRVLDLVIESGHCGYNDIFNLVSIARDHLGRRKIDVR